MILIVGATGVLGRAVSDERCAIRLPARRHRARVRIPRAAHAWYAANPRDGADAILRFLAKHPIR